MCKRRRTRASGERYLKILQVVQSLLVCGIGFLQVVQHEITVACGESAIAVLMRRPCGLTQATPNLSVCRLDLDNGLQVIDSMGKLVFAAEDARHGLHGRTDHEL